MSEKHLSPAELAARAARHKWEALVGAGALASVALGAAKVRHERKLRYEQLMRRTLEKHQDTYQLFEFGAPKRSLQARAVTRIAAVALAHPEGLTNGELRRNVGLTHRIIDGNDAISVLRHHQVVAFEESGKGKLLKPTIEFTAVVHEEPVKWAPLVKEVQSYDETFQVEKLAARLYHTPFEDRDD